MRDERKDEMREKIRLAAVELIEERGLDDTTIDALAERAGIGRRTFFRYFPTKEAVLFTSNSGFTFEDELVQGLDDGLHPVAALKKSFKSSVGDKSEPSDLARRRRRLRAELIDHPLVSGYYFQIFERTERKVIEIMRNHPRAGEYHELLPSIVGGLIHANFWCHMESGEPANVEIFTPDWCAAMDEVVTGFHELADMEKLGQPEVGPAERCSVADPCAPSDADPRAPSGAEPYAVGS